jgi:large subunit ribosomal protein L25
MTINLKAEKRGDIDQTDAQYILGVLYGQGIENQNLKIKRLDMEKTLSLAGESSLIDLEIDGQIVKVLIKDTQFEPIKNRLRHVDFYQVNMSKKVKAEVPLHFFGEAKAIKELGGMLIKNIHELEVECLPSDLVAHIDIDLAFFDEMPKSLKLSDVVLPKGIELDADSEEVIAMVVEPIAEVAEVPTAKDGAKDEKEAPKTEDKK